MQAWWFTCLEVGNLLRQLVLHSCRVDHLSFDLLMSFSLIEVNWTYLDEKHYVLYLLSSTLT